MSRRSCFLQLMSNRAVRSLTFYVAAPPVLLSLMREFRLIVNKSIRIAHRGDLRSRFRLTHAAYSLLSRDHHIYKQYIPSAFEVAMGCLKTYRRKVRKGRRAGVPYLRRLLLKAENQSYRLDRATGRLRIPIRRGERVEFDLRLSEWHLSILADPSWGLGSLTITPDIIVLAVRKSGPDPYEPEAAIALDTNEDSLDGVAVRGGVSALVTVPFPEVRVVQATHFRRRRRLARKKVHDRRLQRRLLDREGRRGRNRVRQRLHVVSKGLVQVAKSARSAIVLEELTLHGAGGRSRKMNRRLASCPRGEIHRQIEYKAALARAPIIKVNPAWTSKTCPVCGARRRDRVGKVFVCLACDWEM